MVGWLTKAHIEHPVCLVEHKVSYSLEVGGFRFHQVNQPSLGWGRAVKGVASVGICNGLHSKVCYGDPYKVEAYTWYRMRREWKTPANGPELVTSTSVRKADPLAAEPWSQVV